LLDRLSAIKRRCTNPDDPHYADYGGRGITLEPELADPAAFLRYIKTLPGYDVPGMEIDRIENNSGYVRGNIRFATRDQNLANRSNSVRIVYQGQTYTAEAFWLSYCPAYRQLANVSRKIKRGYSPERIIDEQDKCRGAYVRHSQLGAKS